MQRCLELQKEAQSAQRGDLIALEERKQVQAAKHQQFQEQRQHLRKVLLREEGPSMRKELEDKVL